MKDFRFLNENLSWNLQRDFIQCVQQGWQAAGSPTHSPSVVEGVQTKPNISRPLDVKKPVFGRPSLLLICVITLVKNSHNCCKNCKCFQVYLYGDGSLYRLAPTRALYVMMRFYTLSRSKGNFWRFSLSPCHRATIVAPNSLQHDQCN